jgi:hypothetical protein
LCSSNRRCATAGGAHRTEEEEGSLEEALEAVPQPAVYVVLLKEYPVVFENLVLRQTYFVSSRDGLDTVSNVERFQFDESFYVPDFTLGQLVPEPPPQ